MRRASRPGAGVLIVAATAAVAWTTAVAMPASVPPRAPQLQDRVAVTAAPSASNAEVMQVRVRNDHAFAIEALVIAYGTDPADPDGDEAWDWFHHLDGRVLQPGEGPIAPGGTRELELDVGERDRARTQVWVHLAMFSDLTWSGDEEAAGERLRLRRNEAEDLGYWVDVLGGFLETPPRQAKRILADRLAFRRSGDPQRYPDARLRFREIQTLIREDDDTFREALRARLEAYRTIKALAEREFRRATPAGPPRD